MTRWPGPPPVTDGNSRQLDELDDATCWDLLAGVAVGRVAVGLDGGDVLVVPVNFRVEGRAVVFRAGTGTLTQRLASRATFQADAFDENRRLGWSVLAHGTVTVTVHDADQDGVPQPWPEGHTRALVRIDVDRVSGRVLRHQPYESDARGYL